MLRLEAVDRYNLPAVLALSVADGQQDFVAPNAYSLAQAYAQPECVPLAVYDGNEPVGFVMYCLDPDLREYCVYRLMIDKKHQSKGYGREALWLVVNRLRADREHHAVYISCDPGNEWAIRLYESMGFVTDGRMEEGETVYRLAY